MDVTSKKLESGVGFSKGCAEFTLKKPPPLVPSCLIAICDAAGPSARICCAPSAAAAPVRSSSVAVAEPSNVCTTPCDTSTSARTSESGSST